MVDNGKSTQNDYNDLGVLHGTHILGNLHMKMIENHWDGETDAGAHRCLYTQLRLYRLKDLGQCCICMANFGTDIWPEKNGC